LPPRSYGTDRRRQRVSGSNTFGGHKEVLDGALKQVPAPRRKNLVRVDGAGASHDLVGHLLSTSWPRKILLFTCGWMITASDEALTAVPGDAWKLSTNGNRTRGA